MNKVMFDSNEVAALIKSGKPLLLAGDESQLRKLPRGSWIGGTIPYFMSEKGGEFSKDKIFVTELPSFVTSCKIQSYDERSVQNVYRDGHERGFSVIILPASSQTHLSFSLNAPRYESFASKPLIGWVAGVALPDLEKITPKVFNGQTGDAHENGAVVLHASLPANKMADINIINIFEQGQGDVLTFDKDAFSFGDVNVNGKKTNFASYLKEKNIDTRLPLVANYGGVMINCSFQGVNEASGEVDFYAPLFKGVEYRVARPFNDYVREFSEKVPKSDSSTIAFSCNCILNYLYAELEGKKTANVTGPITFGEIALQLLNQTFVYVSIIDV